MVCAGPNQASPPAEGSSPARVRQRQTARHKRECQPSPELPNGVFLADAASRPWSRQSSTVSIAQMHQMISDDQLDTQTYGVSDLRDGFFDAMFVKSQPVSAAELWEHGKESLPAEFEKPPLFAIAHFLPRQWHDLQSIVRRVTTTRAGISLLKSFVAFYVAYVICLVPPFRAWLGPYHYMMALSVIVNHPARPMGAQVDGAALTILGIACGLGWGAVGLLLSTSTLAARAGYGGILALFLALFTATTALIRAFFIRFHQAVLSAGIAVIFTTLAQTSNRQVGWAKLLEYAVPWLLGQAIALIVNCLVFPDAGSRSIACALNATFQVMQVRLTHRLKWSLAHSIHRKPLPCRGLGAKGFGGAWRGSLWTCRRRAAIWHWIRQ